MSFTPKDDHDRRPVARLSASVHKPLQKVDGRVRGGGAPHAAVRVADPQVPVV